MNNQPICINKTYQNKDTKEKIHITNIHKYVTEFIGVNERSSGQIRLDCFWDVFEEVPIKEKTLKIPDINKKYKHIHQFEIESITISKDKETVVNVINMIDSSINKYYLKEFHKTFKAC